MSDDKLYYVEANEGLKRLGFKKRMVGIYTLPLADTFAGWMSLAVFKRFVDDPIYVALVPLVGVRSGAVEDMYSDLSGVKRHAYMPPTVLMHIGSVMPIPYNHVWNLLKVPQPGDERRAATIRDLLETIRTYGCEYMRSGASLEVLRRRLLNLETTLQPDIPKRLAIIELLLGNRSRAIELLDEYLEPLRDAGDGYLALQQQFVERFKAL